MVRVLLILWLLPVALAAQEAGVEGMRLEVGDAVRIELPDRPSTAGVYRVAYDGSILLPLVGFIEVEGRRFGRVREEIAARYEAALDEPALRVTPLIRVMVVGEVGRPGYVIVDPADRIGEVLEGAGGLTDLADRRRIQLLRSGQVVAHLDPDSRLPEMQFEPGDRIVVDQIGWVRQHAGAFIQAFGSIAAAGLAGLIFR